MATTINDLAKMIMNMRYGDLKQVASHLASACEDKEARPKLETAGEFADLLYDWAEATATDSD